MSVLDRIFSESAASNDGALASLASQIEQAQQLLATQQGSLQALGITDAAQSTALAAATALNVAQQASIAAAQAAADAAQAAADAQQSALAAATTINTAQATAITGLDNAVRAVTRDLSVAAYTPLDVDGRHVPLSNANFQDAIEAAIVDAYARSISDATALYRGGYRVYIPEGVWRITRALFFPAVGFDYPYISTPALSGAGMHRTALVTAPGFAPRQGAAIRVGGDQTADALGSYTNTWQASDFSLFAGGGSVGGMNGLHASLTYRTCIERVFVCGFQNTGTDYQRYGWGFKFDDVMPDGSIGSSNTQHLVLRDCWSQGNMGGYYFRNCLPVTVYNCVGNQNYFCDAVVDTTFLSWHGGCWQGGGDMGAGYSCRLVGGQPRVISGWGTIVTTGTGAAVATADGDTTVVTGLTGMLRDQHLHNWLELTKTSGAFASNDLVSGIFLIVEVLSATSVRVRKGSAHAATGSLAWKVRRGRSVHITVGGKIYHEGTIPAVIGCYTLEEGAGSVQVLDGCGANAGVYAEVLGSWANVAPPLTIAGLVQSVMAVRARYCQGVTAIESLESQLDIDDYTREGSLFRSTSHVFGGVAANIRGHILAGNRLTATRLRSLCREASPLAMFDARVTGSVVKSGNNVSQWTSLISSADKLTLLQPTKYPQYVDSDPVFGGAPAIKFTETTYPDAVGLSIAIDKARLPPAFRPSMFVIVRVPSATALASGLTRRIQLKGGSGNASLYELVFNQSDLNANFVGFSAAGVSQLFSQINPTTIRGEAIIAGGAGRCYPAGTSADAAAYRAEYAFTDWDNSNDLTFTLEPNLGFNGYGEMSVAFAAVFAHGLSVDLREQLLDACATEFAIPGR